jgi:hypothetical protein
MMVLQIYFSDDEIKAFFEDNGFNVEEREAGEWLPAYHNKSEYVTKMRLFVIIDKKQIEARKLFERITEKRMRRYLVPVSLESKRMIETEFKNSLK